LVVTTSAIICAVLVDITIAIFFAGLFGLLVLFYAAIRERKKLIVCLGLSAVAGGTFIAILIVNQLTTGLADDQGLLFFWHHANVEKLAHWGALPFVIMTHLGRQSQQTGSMPVLSTETVVFLLQSFRFDLVAPLMFGGALVTLPSLVRGHRNRNLDTVTSVMIALVLSYVAVALDARNRFYRYASFATAPAIICAIILWNMAPSDTFMARISRSALSPLSLYCSASSMEHILD
jgi:hypothetical protein